MNLKQRILKCQLRRTNSSQRLMFQEKLLVFAGCWNISYLSQAQHVCQTESHLLERVIGTEGRRRRSVKGFIKLWMTGQD